MATALSPESPMFESHPPIETCPGAWALVTWMVRSARAAHPERTLAGRSQAALLFAHLLARRQVLRNWHPAARSPLRDALAARPSLVSVVRRPYINTGWGAARRLRAIEEHYRHASQASRSLPSGPDAMLHLARTASLGSHVDVVLDSPAWFIHEGELSLNLFHGGERIYTLAFSFGLDAGEPVAHVGALQGLGKEHALDVYRTLTQALHGLRPRDLLIHAFRTVCREFGIARWLAVGDDRRVSRSPYFGPVTPICSSYDAAWSEHAGVLRADGFHDLSVEVARRAHAEIPTRKRNRYRQRYAMLDRLEVDLVASLRTPAEPGRRISAVRSAVAGSRPLPMEKVRI